ncbi:hypothetical protein DM860_006907 [Cuscuta australis]|uniref:SAM domain-containing protein n=1 Tax=Cuscuta australis TaxID=267555 RepID=A0A328E5F3_9ASTE|nr:hypothetical protein DM860_006907 [Cuscuta australis]
MGRSNPIIIIQPHPPAHAPTELRAWCSHHLTHSEETALLISLPLFCGERFTGRIKHPPLLRRRIRISWDFELRSDLRSRVFELTDDQMEPPSRVTITLGRKGQVVKKAAASTDFSFADSQPSVGSKRSVKDRLGAVGGSTSQLSSKRQRGDGSGWSSSAYSGVDDASLDKDDLRFKILRKSVLNRRQSNEKQNAVDLRDVLSRSGQSSTGPINTRPHMPEPKDTRLHHIDPRDSRQRMIEGRDGRQHMPESRRLRPPMPDPRDSRQLMSEPKDVRYHMSEPRSADIVRQTPSARNVDSPLVDSRASFSPWTLDRLRRKSPDGILSSRGASPPMRGDELQRRPTVRAYDDPRLGSLSSKDFSPFSRPVSSTYLANTAPPARTMVPLHASIPPPGSLVQKGSFAVEDVPTVDGFLHSLGLDKYAINFKAEEVDMHALRQMGDNDLKELGVPMGPRKKIVLALSRTKRHP